MVSGHVPMSYFQEGYALSTALIDSIGALLAQPAIAAVLGLVLGVGLLLASRNSFEHVAAEDPTRGLLFVTTALMGRLLVATLLLYAYHRFSPAGYPFFGIALAGAFLVMYTFELVRYAGLHRYARPVAGSRDGR